MRRLVSVSLLPVPLLLAALLPGAARAETLPLCPANGPQVCFTDASASPKVTVPAAGSSETNYMSFTATVTNRGTNTATHVSMTDLPPGAPMTVVSVSGTNPDGQGAACTIATGTCQYANVAAKSSVTYQVVLAVGSTTVANSPSENVIKISVDEGPNDTPGNGGKQDTTPLHQSVQLLPRDGASVFSLVPATLGASKVLTTDKLGKSLASATTTQQEVATTEIPPLSQPIFASVFRTPPSACPVVNTCAMPDWMQVSVPDFAGSSSKYLKTTLRVDSSLLLNGQNAGNVILYYQPVDGAPVQTFNASRSCSSPGCVTATKEKDGDLTIVFYEAHNGRMRL
jgi:uncharacterized repeat protein (TIGR01451 family)